MAQRPTPHRMATAPLPRLSVPPVRKLPSIPEASATSGRRASFSKSHKLTNPAPKAQRTSKTSHKLVVLPSEPQKKPLVDVAEEEDLYTAIEEDVRSPGERMSKTERQKARYPRLTAYCVADGIKPKLTTAFMKREHGVTPRVFDDAIYAMYHLPLLPGYVGSVNVRSSIAAQSPNAADAEVESIEGLTEAEENGYQGHYFSEPEEREPTARFLDSPIMSPEEPFSSPPAPPPQKRRKQSYMSETSRYVNVAEVIIFTYGVVVFFNLQQEEERAILDDLEGAGVYSRKIAENDWEVEECHFEHDAAASKPRIYNDFFTLKSRSHLLKLSISHALAQSTLLARYESLTHGVLTSPETLSIPHQLSLTGKLSLRRGEAMRLTGRLFRLRRDVNLVSNVLDVPELFWSEASLGELYGAVREYMEISERVEVLNAKLGVVKDLLDMIHEHLNGNAMVRITWIIIWLIVVAIVVELVSPHFFSLLIYIIALCGYLVSCFIKGEALARVVVHASYSGTVRVSVQEVLSREEALMVLERMGRSVGGSNVTNIGHI